MLNYFLIFSNIYQLQILYYLLAKMDFSWIP